MGPIQVEWVCGVVWSSVLQRACLTGSTLNPKHSTPHTARKTGREDTWASALVFKVGPSYKLALALKDPKP